MAKDDDLELVTCEESLGTIAIVDGDTQGWAEFDLGSPRPLINSLAIDSGCFTPHSAASGEPFRPHDIPRLRPHRRSPRRHDRRARATTDLVSQRGASCSRGVGT